ncbi:NAD(P)/FAD-dependent oxidoreductase [Salinisphaera sp. Q1T1-3]|uniref:flavin-containing monooxygenase n=1 Tax=Salinisphaera sp. Q1T1-3 TaxID=2321229 RepID=UPI000E754102|nr:NAD(P)/FAD-dependent oxidoreductase [Salinisphaera sp. Q1T1-3]RJS94866.1 FAD-dependent oxidoreductase [Salinisphaera sp. Q1T1-3]
MTALPADIDTLVVGAGQAGVAMSEHLSAAGVPHLVLERDRIAERWRTGRWDSLVANGPAWHDRFPGLTFTDLAPGEFADKNRIAAYFEDYAARFSAPIRTGIAVESVRRRPGESGFVVETSQGTLIAQRVVAATGAFQKPVIPEIAPDTPTLHQLHSSAYRNPEQLPAGGVLVVGSGSSGTQIADELLRAGRDVYLSVGPHDRPPRSYRGRDFCWWLGVLGLWDAETAGAEEAHVTIAVSGAHGGHTVDFRELAHRGMTLVGRTRAFDDGQVAFDDDLAANLARGDENYRALLDAADAYVARYGLDLPPEPEARRMAAQPQCVSQPRRRLDLEKADVRTVIWATGFASDYRWLAVDAVDAAGQPRHHRGVGTEPGVYFLGLPWLSHRGSSFIWGVWHDARRIADHIVTRRAYFGQGDDVEAAADPATAETPAHATASR